MRSNGLRFALAALLAPAAVFAQESAAPASGSPMTPAESAPAQPVGGVSPSPAAPAEASPAAPAPEFPVGDVAGDAAGASPAPADPGAHPAQMPGEPVAAPEEIPPAAESGTEAEQAYADIYGPTGEPGGDTEAAAPGAYDPWENYNRRMHRFNNAVDRRVARPLARGYVRAVPRPVRTGVSNFFNNLGQPLTVVNSLLQGKPKQAGQAFGRFLLNSTFGLAGIFDPATRAQLPQKSEDFGQTLGVWGWKRSRYFELPLFGPRTVRDVFGMAGDAPLSPLRQVDPDRVRVPLQGLQLVDVRAQLLSTDALREGAEDDYALVRDAWMQRRAYQISGDRPDAGEDLPDYLRDDDETIVPVDAMPVSVPGG